MVLLWRLYGDAKGQLSHSERFGAERERGDALVRLGVDATVIHGSHRGVFARL
jgi:hypothetical protein